MRNCDAETRLQRHQELVSKLKSTHSDGYMINLTAVLVAMSLPLLTEHKPEAIGAAYLEHSFRVSFRGRTTLHGQVWDDEMERLEALKCRLRAADRGSDDTRADSDSGDEGTGALDADGDPQPASSRRGSSSILGGLVEAFPSPDAGTGKQEECNPGPPSQPQPHDVPPPRDVPHTTGGDGDSGGDGDGDGNAPFYMPAALRKMPADVRGFGVVHDLMFLTQHAFHTGLLPAYRTFRGHVDYIGKANASGGHWARAGFRSAAEMVNTIKCMRTCWQGALSDRTLTLSFMRFMSYQATWLLTYLRVLAPRDGVVDVLGANGFGAIWDDREAPAGTSEADTPARSGDGAPADGDAGVGEATSACNPQLAAACAAAGVQPRDVYRVLHLFPCDVVIDTAELTRHWQATRQLTADRLTTVVPAVVDLFVTLLSIPQTRCNASMTAAIVQVAYALQQHDGVLRSSRDDVGGVACGSACVLWFDSTATPRR